MRKFLFALSGLLLSVGAAASQQPAFIGAVGHGATTQGGRGGAIIFVTNTNDSGAGSLRACVEATGPRVCVFRTWGVIELASSLEIRNPNISIHGETAPSGGITLIIDTPASGANAGKNTPLVIRNTSEVIVRNIRIRVRLPSSVTKVDAVTVDNSHHVYLSHISGAWATDENVNAHRQADFVTIDWSFFAEGLAPHSKCALLGSDPAAFGSDPAAPQHITFYRNICHSNNDRNTENNHFGGSCIEIRGNIFHNARSQWAEIRSQHAGGTAITYEGNHFKAGPATNATTYIIDYVEEAGDDYPVFFSVQNSSYAPPGKQVIQVAPDTVAYRSSTRPCASSWPYVSVNHANQANYNAVRAQAGAFPRDSLDIRFRNEVNNWMIAGTGSIKSAPGNVPNPGSGPAQYPDVDNDGISDNVEYRYGADVGEFDPWDDEDGDGWSSFDEFVYARMRVLL